MEPRVPIGVPTHSGQIHRYRLHRCPRSYPADSERKKRGQRNQSLAPFGSVVLVWFGYMPSAFDSLSDAVSIALSICETYLAVVLALLCPSHFWTCTVGNSTIFVITVAAVCRVQWKTKCGSFGASEALHNAQRL